MKSITNLLAIVLFIALIIFAQTNNAPACSRVVYQGPNNTIITARTMDWESDIQTNLWIFPSGMERNGVVGPNSLKWTSKYGSVIASAYEMSSSDGMNEKGLVANILWLSESEYLAWDGKSKPGLSIAAWAQYVLDNFSTVNEAVTELEKENFAIVVDEMPGLHKLATLHLCLSDATGDNAILEYINGKLIIHHDKSYVVATNSPTYEKQLALAEYWNEIGGTIMLPGTNRAADRFVRASFYIKAIPQTDDINIALAGVFGVIRNVSVPYGISTPNKPNISSTRWRAVADHKNKVYYFETALSPFMLWVDFKDVDFTSKGTVKKLSLLNGEIYAGNAFKNFVDSEPFKFAGLNN